MINQTIQEIRKKLYLRKDGASSTSMRTKGLEYKMNWGVPVPSLRELAQPYAPNVDLANEMWKQGTRELKIMATLIQDPKTFSGAEEWVQSIDTTELAEQAVLNLFSKLPQASELAKSWIQAENNYIQLSGFLLYIRLFMQNMKLNPNDEQVYFKHLFSALNNTELSINNRALNSLIYLIRTDNAYIGKTKKQIDQQTGLSSEQKENLLEILDTEFENESIE